MCIYLLVAGNFCGKQYGIDVSVSISLQITDENEMKIYKTKMADWEREKERQMHEFTITEDDLDADKRIGASVEVLVGAFRRVDYWLI